MSDQFLPRVVFDGNGTPRYLVDSFGNKILDPAVDIPVNRSAPQWFGTDRLLTEAQPDNNPPTESTDMATSTERTLGGHLGQCTLAVIGVAAVLNSAWFGIYGVIQAWNHLSWVWATAITVSAVSLVVGIVGYLHDVGLPHDG